MTKLRHVALCDESSGIFVQTDSSKFLPCGPRQLPTRRIVHDATCQPVLALCGSTFALNLELKVTLRCDTCSKHYRVDVAMLRPRRTLAVSRVGPEGLNLLGKGPVFQQIFDESRQLAILIDEAPSPASNCAVACSSKQVINPSSASWWPIEGTKGRFRSTLIFHTIRFGLSGDTS